MDGRNNCRNKAALLNFSGVEWTESNYVEIWLFGVLKLSNAYVVCCKKKKKNGLLSTAHLLGDPD